MLQPSTLATMFAPHYQPDPRLTGMGLAFFRRDASGHLVHSHDGIMPGFHSALAVAPDDGVGLFAFTNGSSGAMAWLPFDLGRLLHYLLGVPDETVRGDVPHHPEIWDEICGRYRLPDRIGDLRERVMMGGGVQVLVRGGQLVLRVLIPVPALYAGLPLHPDDASDPYVFRLDLSRFGMATVRLVFAHKAGAGTTAVHADLGAQPVSLYKQSAVRNTRLWVTGGLGAIGMASAALVIGRRRSRRGRQRGGR